MKYTFSGFKSSDILLTILRNALLPDREFAIMMKKYEDGERSSNFLQEYIKITKAKNLSTTSLLDTLFLRDTSFRVISQKPFSFLIKTMTDNQSLFFNYVIENAKTYKKNLNHPADLEASFSFLLKDILTTIVQDSIIDEKALKQVWQQAEALEVVDYMKPTMFHDAYLVYYLRTQQYDLAEQLFFEDVKLCYRIKIYLLVNNWSHLFYKYKAKPDLLRKALIEMKKVLSIETEPEYHDTIAHLHWALSEKEEAISQQSQAMILAKQRGYSSKKLLYFEEELTKMKSN